MKRILLLTFLLVQILLFAGVPAARSQETTPFVYVLTYDGAVTPSMVEYMQRGIRYAERDGAEALIFQLNTPGGRITLRMPSGSTPLASGSSLKNACTRHPGLEADGGNTLPPMYPS